ncbi:MAG TPA: chemotaxis-specific protein-glutamate methyltransferase CheB [Gammaproteobacteria bacterium]|nr:chemotaxis-specific protein-glutamate methyltransferase CheB [Gammaproteobacteria bacterium]
MKIGIVNPSPSAVEAQRRALGLRPAHTTIWIAASGKEALAHCALQLPDLVLIDVNMPGTDGVGTTRHIMREFPCPILIVTSSVTASTARVFEAMGHGALDAVDAPGAEPASVAAFLKKIDTLEKLVGSKGVSGSRQSLGDTGVILRRDLLVAIGASAGGPAALATLLGALPRDFPAGIVIVQHVDERFARSMAEWLAQQCRMEVRPAAEDDRPTAGVALLAATNQHLALKAGNRLGYCMEPASAVYRPSVDVFLESVCTHWKGDAIGVLLTGMGRDGARGLKALRSLGHYTIAQDSVTSAVYGMPKAAAALGAAVDVLPLDKIAPRLLETVMYGVIR